MALLLNLPETHDFYIRKGNDISEPFGFTDENLQPIDLTGWAIKAQLRAKPKRTATLLATFTIDRAKEAEGIIALTLTEEESGALAGKKGYYDILLTDLAGFDETYISGQVTLIDTITVKADPDPGP